MTFYYVEDNFDFEYTVMQHEIRSALFIITGAEDLEKYSEQEGFESEYALADWLEMN